MKWFYNLKIRAKLLIGFILIALIVGLVGYVGMTNIKALDESDTELYEQMTVPIAQLSDLSTAFQRVRANVRDAILANDLQTINDVVNKINERKVELDTAATEIEKTLTSEEMKTAFQEFTDARKAYDKELDRIIALASQNQDAEATLLLAEDGAGGIASRAEQDAIAKLVDLKVADAKAHSTANNNLTIRAKNQLNLMMVAGVLLAIAMGIFLSRIISRPLIKTEHMLKEMSRGHLGERLNMDTKDEIGQMAIAMDGFADDLQNALIGTMNRISEGDVSFNIENKDAQDEITPAVKKMIETIRGLIAEATMLAQAATAGRLDIRGHAEAFQGGYREIIEGFNETLDSVVGPLNIMADCFNRISKGDIPEKITTSYNGDFNTIKNNLNTCIDAVNALVADARMLEKAGVEGRLNIRADANKHGGDFAKIIDGVNNTLDAVIGPLNMAAECVEHISKGNIPAPITDTYNGDFNTLKNNLNICFDAINTLVEDTGILAQAGIDGQLEIRADANKHQGDFARVINGVNANLDAVVAPVRETLAVLKELAQGNLNTKMVGNYQGDYTIIKTDMNQTITFLKRYVAEITHVLEEIGRGNLDLNITDDYLGDFQAIKTALNGITTSLSGNMSDINIAAGQVEIGSQQISNAGQALSQGTTEQASSIQQLTASISEVATETKKNAMNANEANELALKVRTSAQVGNSQMSTMVTAMVDINESSKRAFQK